MRRIIRRHGVTSPGGRRPDRPGPPPHQPGYLITENIGHTRALFPFGTGNQAGQNSDMVLVAFGQGLEELFELDIGDSQRGADMDFFEPNLQIENPLQSVSMGI